MPLNEEEGKFLLDLARRGINTYMKEGKMLSVEEKEVPKRLRKKGASFVTLTIAGSLRGCIGNLEAVSKLYEDVLSNTVNAAFRDPRFYPLSEAEYEIIKIEVSVLSRPRPSAAKKIIPEKHGVIIEHRGRRATFLPQVWSQLPEKAEFLSHLCMKAGLGQKEWENKETKFFVYTVQSFEE